MSDKSAKNVFTEAMELTGPERDAFIAQSCRGDEKLHATVKQLFAAHDTDSNFLEEAPLNVDLNEVARWAHPDELLIGEQINGWTIDRVIATGGMGTVYQASGKNNGDSVAIKLMRSGIASENAMRRFRFESDVLAHLNHDGIARVLESGTHDDGLGGVPFFVMEYVPDALPITEYSLTRDLNLHQRVELLAQVCDAIHHGHQKGVIHRDLKPANILVDSSNRPKVIDFGVARATDSDLAVTTIATSAGDLLGTLQYMSPEQCGTDPGAVDIRSDIYALGVVLYELICGVVPYDVREVGVMEAVRRIQETKPRSPHEAKPGLPEDLSTIVLKALEKEPERRYQSALELAADLRRFINNQPIMARPPSAIYQMRKFTRRNKGLVTGISIAALSLIAGTVVAVTYAVSESQAREAESQLRKIAEAESTIDKVVNNIFTGLVSAMNPDPQRALGREATVVEVLEQWESRLATDFADQPLVEAAICGVIGTTYRQLGHYDRSVKNRRRRLQLCETHKGKEHQDTLEAMLELGDVLDLINRVDEAEPLIRHVYETRLRLYGEDDHETLHAALYLAKHLNRIEQYDEAEPLARLAFELHRERHGEDHLGTLNFMQTLASALSGQGRVDEAESLYREALEHYRQTVGNDNSETVSSMYFLAEHLLRGMHRYAEAEQLFREALATGAGVYDKTHPHLLITREGLIDALIAQGRHDEAEAEQRILLDETRLRYGPDHSEVARIMHHLAEVLWRNGKRVEAENLGREALAMYVDIVDNHAQEHNHAADVLSEILLAKGDRDEAVMILVEALDRCRTAFGDKHLMTASAMSHLGHRYWTLQKFEEAEQMYSASLAIHRELLDPEHRDTLFTMSSLAAQYQGQAKTRQAHELKVEVLEIRRRTLGDEDPDTVSSMNDVGVSYFAEGQFEKAAEVLEDALQGRRRLLGEENPSTVMTMHNLATQYTELGRYDEAEQLFATVIEICERVPPQYAWHLANYRGGYGQCLTMLERYDEAEDQLLVAYKGLEAALSEDHSRTTKTAHRLVELYDAWDKPEEAAQWRAKLDVPADD